MSYITATRRCGMSEDAKKDPSELHRVMVRCAESGEGVPTGTRIDPASFGADSRRMHIFKCPHCFHEHTWSKEDAWTEAGAC
jgi:hypothetical protein